MQRYIPSVDIAHGTQFPIELALEYLGNGSYNYGLNIGCGTGDKMLDWSDKFHIHGLDINPKAVKEARKNAIQSGYPEANIMFHLTDISQIFTGNTKEPFVNLPEFYQFVVAEGLFCNLIGENFKKTIQAIDYQIEPSGYVFVADCLRIDPSNASEELIKTMGFSSLDQWHKFIQRWKARYQNNVDLGLPDGTFMVAKPGEAKFVEWGSPKVLSLLSQSKLLERLARHFRKEELISSFKEQDLFLKKWQPTVFYSRTGDPLIGIVAVFQKSGKYKYLNGLIGKKPSGKAAFLEELSKNPHDEDLWRFWSSYLIQAQMLFGNCSWLDFAGNTLSS